MAIRNKMIAEGLDPNLLEYVCKSYLPSVCATSLHSIKDVLATAFYRTPDAPVPDGGIRNTNNQDVTGTSSDSESSFSD